MTLLELVKAYGDARLDPPLRPTQHGEMPEALFAEIERRYHRASHAATVAGAMRALDCIDGAGRRPYEPDGEMTPHGRRGDL